ncbi:sigma-70 family RNA polymerase sigma factor [Sphingomonas sp. HITSZ_GF]|uniref:RNA polymerase sigma factor n=1 Tax=Sphingomonas sp. HITSZ_GF TaxID=3037247 RepID=UPI00240E8B5A|nr:sigma-70 family RNA polymerase sigma factor [Sphingomonas sp. HITSZ_GF]MDG2535360.1 sigma-70 family RNA polymerase sigma factor [Sphingomonas sp. HITSZ_GF]
MHPTSESGLERQSVPNAEQFSRRWRPALMAFFLRRVRNPTDAEDLTQEVFVRMLNLTEDRPSDAYVFQIAQNLLIDRSRKHLVRERYRHGVAADAGRELDDFDPHRLVEGRDQLAKIVGALGEMPERTRTIFVLYRVENMRQETIANAFGISSSAVKQHVAKAMALLARKMRDDR